ncbi:MAG: ABC transporter C-terminal domain-containing protein [Acidimicrobiia bacterium]
MRLQGLNRNAFALRAVIVGAAVGIAACSSTDTGQESTEDTSATVSFTQFENEMAELEDEIAELSDQLAAQSTDIAALQQLTSELDRENASSRASFETIGPPPPNPEISARLSAVEVGLAEHAEMLGWEGSYSDGMWADMQAVLDCLEEIVGLGGVASIPNNSCRLIGAGMIGAL